MKERLEENGSKNVPEMGWGVSTIEYQLLFWIHIFVNPLSPGP